MKSIELTQDHKIKLLEMCKVLFSEYKIYFWLEPNNMLFIENEQKKIHWFEFCMTHLARKLLNPSDMALYQTTGNFLCAHPVDYLYSLFLKPS